MDQRKDNSLPTGGEKTEPVQEKSQPKKKKKRSKLVIGLVLTSVLLLAGIAVASAYKLYQLREEEQVAPTAPKEAPAVGEPTPGCELSFFIASPTPTLTDTPTPTITPTGTITPTNTPTGTLTPTLTPTNTPTGTLSPTLTPTNTPTGTIAPTDSPTPTPTEKLVAQADTPTPTKIELPEAGFTVPSQLLVLLGSIISLSGLLFIF